MCSGDTKKSWDRFADDTGGSASDAGKNLGHSLYDNVSPVLADAGKQVGDALHEGIQLDTWSQGGPLINFGQDDNKSTSKDTTNPTATDTNPTDSENADGTPKFSNSSITDTEIRRRRALNKLRRGMLTTIGTSSQGLLTNPQIDIPVLASGLKQRLGI